MRIVFNKGNDFPLIVPFPQCPLLTVAWTAGKGLVLTMGYP